MPLRPSFRGSYLGLNSLSGSVCKCLRKTGDDKGTLQYQSAFRLVAFSRFLLNRVAVTKVTAKNEIYAFDMFEALNTTGEPLTAFETFRPKVVEAEKVERYETSPSRVHIRRVEEALEHYSTADRKQKATTKLLVPFALADTGTKLTKHLSDQRRYLQEQYAGATGIEKKRSFVKHMAQVCSCINDLWPESADDSPKLPGDEADLTRSRALFCMEVLRKANHDITLALLSRYWSAYLDASVENKKYALGELYSAILAVAAFFAVWRGTRPDTQNIDSHYRELMEKGRPGIGVLPFSLRADKSSELPSTADLKKAFRDILVVKGKITGKKDFVTLASSNPTYGASQPLTRFLLLVASHDTEPSEGGLLKAARAGTKDLLTLTQWRSSGCKTVEHVAPQEQCAAWDESFYKTPGLLDRLGNLVLLPQLENITLGQRPWHEKKAIYKVFLATTKAEFDVRIASAAEEGVKLSARADEIVGQSVFLPQVATVSEVEIDWSVDLIQARSTCLADLSWRYLGGWLGY